MTNKKKEPDQFQTNDAANGLMGGIYIFNTQNLAKSDTFNSWRSK